MRDSAIAVAFAKDVGLTPDVPDAMDPDTEHRLVTYPADVTYAHILEGCARRINYEVAVKENKLIFRRPRYLEQQSPACTFKWGQNLRSVSIDINSKSMPSSITVTSPKRDGASQSCRRS